MKYFILPKALTWTVAGAMLGAVSLVAVSNRAMAEEITLNMIGSWAPGTSADADIAMRFIEEVSRISGGEITVNYRGAAEVVPIFDQPDAIVRGLFDVWYGAPNYWAGTVPASYVTELSEFDVPDQGPGSELFALMDKIFGRSGIKYLGHYSGDAEDGNHYLISQEKITKISDLKGKQIRVPPLTRDFVVAAGGEPVTLPPGDVYVALERGTVSGFTWPYFDSFTSFGWHEVSKYLINQPIYRNGINIVMNQDRWDSLPEKAHDDIMKAVETTQLWALGWVAAHQATQLPAMQAAGMEVIELSDEDAKEWREKSRAALWKRFEDTIDAEDYKEAKRLIGD
ncbi:TRAP transporter substrate-binding protein [Defluviimonas sp. SAOS-178_SWC]|uniref:TRAP transporter substrate-binding protein n=1 Tax=Defluviimonas sp. SAOS-178_SWC TaxID=3121287 RepID=UPI003221FC1D